jgi:hypothetical protein
MLIVKVGAAGVLACGVLLGVPLVLADREAPEPLGSVVLHTDTAPSRATSPPPRKDPAVPWACRDVLVERSQAAAADPRERR